MTNKEAAKWIQIYIDEWNKDLNQMEGFGMCLNEKGKKMMKAIEMGRDALKRTDERTKTHACDSIGRSMAVNAVQRIAHMATLPDDDVVIRKSAVEYVLLHLPSAQPEIIRCKECANADENYHCDYMTTWNYGDCFCCYGRKENR